MKQRSKMTLIERLYLLEVIKGVKLTFFRLLKNIILHPFELIRGQHKAVVTVQYPDERRPYPERYRGRHRLTLNDDGSIRCKACFLCATACPSQCIHIEAAEGKGSLEKYPARYEIDTLRCSYCGLCVEACPVDALRMDSAQHPQIYPAKPELFIEDKQTLMKRSKELNSLGKEAVVQKRLEEIKAIEISPEQDPYGQFWARKK